MTAVLLALLAAFSYGVSDYLSGAASRKVHYGTVALVTQLVMTVATWIVVWFVPGTRGGGALTWGLVAGLGSSFGTFLLYRGLGAGQMNVVAPLSAATAAVVPVAAGLLLGERPSWVVLLGVAVIVPAIWLISSGEKQPGSSGRLVEGAIDGLLAGVAFAVSFIALDRAPAGSGLWPAAYAQLSALVVVAIAVGLVLRRARARGALTTPTAKDLAPAGVAGLLGALAVASFLLATGAGLLVVVSVLTSLYPAVTVLLARVLLAERTAPVQVVGLVLAAVGVVLVAAG